MNNLSIGDRVAYSAEWLRSTGQITGDIGHAKGVITKLANLSKETVLAHIKWENNAEFPGRVNVKNLARVGPNSKYCKC